MMMANWCLRLSLRLRDFESKKADGWCVLKVIIDTKGEERARL